jgi:hypothetical protein
VKTKLTITVDADILPRAKRYARSRGVSLSSLINASLPEMAADEAPSFVDRWRGAFEPAQKGDAHCEALADKHFWC